MNLSKHLRPILLILAALRLFSVPGEVRASEPLPAAPDSLILDQGRVLLPERVAALSRDLLAAAREQSVWVYVVTVPSLGVPSSRQSERLVELAHRFTDHWLTERVGVVILFDDESGVEIVVAGREADRQFPSLRLAITTSAALRRAQRAAFSRDRVEQTARAVLEEISGLQERAQKAAHRDRVANWTMMVIIIAGATLVGLADWQKTWRRPPKVPPA